MYEILISRSDIYDEHYFIPEMYFIYCTGPAILYWILQPPILKCTDSRKNRIKITKCGELFT